jgi:hypothetical protein
MGFAPKKTKKIPQKIREKSCAGWTGESAAVSEKRGFLTGPAAGI